MKTLQTLALLLLTLLPIPVLAQVDIRISQVGPYQTFVTNGLWNGSGIGTVNNNYIVVPMSPDSGFCVTVQNNDSAAHSFNITAAVSTNPSGSLAYQGNSTAWRTIGLFNNFNAGAFVGALNSAAGNTQSLYFKSTGAAQVVFIIRNNSPTTGNATIYSAQTTTGGCATTPYPIGQALTRFAATSFGIAQAFTATNCSITAGAALQPIIAINATNGVNGQNATTSLEKLRISTNSAAASIDLHLNLTTNAGVGCTPITAVNAAAQGGPGSQNVVNVGNCATSPPTVNQVIDIEAIDHSENFVIDLSGLWFPAGGTAGYDLTFGQIQSSGELCATLYWSEQ